MKRKKIFKVLRPMLVLMLVLSMMISAVGCKGKDVPSTTGDGDDPGKVDGNQSNASYTYNDYMAGSPKTWNPHEWETNSDSYIMTYTQFGLYEYGFNETYDKYVFVPEMAVDFPVDITKEYAGNEVYGVPADATEGYAFKIALNEKAAWENGDKINADNYIYSMKQMLNPEMKNYRASSYYSGTLTLANAEDYYKQNEPIYTDIYKDDAYRDVADSDMKFSLTKPVVFFNGDTAKKYYDSDSSPFMDEAGNDLFAKYSSQDYNDLTDEAKKDLLTIAKAIGDTNPEAYKEFCFTYDGERESMDFEKVGLKKTGEYEITLILSKPITDFYLKYNLAGGSWLVHEGLYEKNKKETGDIIKTTYGTSVDTYMSYGPYKLTEYQQDKQIRMERNENWYGYTDGKHEGLFQTTAIDTQIVPAQATALQLFIQGKLDNVDLIAEDMGTYRTSDYILYTPQTYTSKFTFNSDKAALKSREVPGVNRTILAYKDFRKAFALSIDRQEFAAQCTATHVAGFGLLNNLYIYDPETGSSYRGSEQGKQALMKLYNADSVDDITGYDKVQAAELFTKAYNDALAAGDIKAGDKIELEFLVYKSDESYVKIVNFVQDAINAAIVGTPLENKVTIKMVPDEDYYDHAKQGAFEIIISTWGGSGMDPYGLMEVYTKYESLHEYGFKPDIQKCTINVNGEEMTKTFLEWYEALCNGEYVTADPDTKLQILAGMEYGILETYVTTPIYYRTATSLYSQKIEYPTYDFVQIIQFGGVRYMTYNYTDAEWEKYCSDNNNQLDY
ncbi:ABC transporter substrate-binding protein [Proteiniborus sp. MB09-C3]|uniref:ABC transporter substrate-binding protein n=1 Tax=Proteiniborus sp. MB09-C3 TaxID=3050072 RepID=UPI002555D03F|nr:ABC transporter substrate-binding protein [Proteiniborus sp. MB09-C3]WIV11701.1 ABC transporter substrate-binding protein [Proteiniborus sp. MB09-C3]